jgi:ubiquinone biosynthesis protein UbiJ
MKKRGLSVVRLAGDLGISRSGVYRIFSGEFSRSSHRSRICAMMTDWELEWMGWERNEKRNEITSMSDQVRELWSELSDLEKRLEQLENQKCP